MKINQIYILLFLPLLIFADDKKYYITNVDIIAQLNADGSMDVVENRTYKFKGRFKYAFQTLKKSEGKKYDIISISEKNNEYFLSNDNTKGGYTLTDKNDHFKIRWNFKAKNESRTFTLKYRIHNLVERYNDVATMYYKFIGADWKKNQKNVSITLLPPENISQYDLQAWLHGPLWGEYRINSDGSIKAWCENLPRKTFFEIRSIYPAELFKGVPLLNKFVKSVIVEEEKKGVEDANQRRELAIIKEQKRIERWKMGKWIVGIFSIICALGWVYLYRTFGRRAVLPYKIDISSEIPEKFPPAVLQYLLANRQVHGNALIATMFDLARKKIVLMKENEIEKKTFFGKIKIQKEYIWEVDRELWDSERGNLLDYENKLLVFIFDEISEGSASITIKKIKKKQSAFTKFFKKWKKEVILISSSKNWFDKGSLEGMKYSFILTGLLAISNIPFAILFGPWAVISGATTILMLILSTTISHRTLEGEILYKKWMSLKKYLNKGRFRKLDKDESLKNISDYLLYGTVLGIKSKAIKEMIGFIPESDFHSVFPWYAYGGGDGHGNPADGFSASFSAMVSTTSSAMSSASGAGGGASSGGGGGAGGGGGGAG